LEQNPEVKESTNIDKDVESNDNTRNSSPSSTTADEKEDNEVESEENGSNDVTEVKDSNGDQSEDNIENGSSKRKSEAGEGDGPDSTDITPKKVKVSDDSTDAVANDGEAIQLEATV